MPDDERGFESQAADRLVAFSDAVVAIAITLLALDLPVPTGATMKGLLHSVHRNNTHYLAFLISFVVIAAAWRRYHSVFRYIERVDPRIRTYNIIWLLTIVLIPFATKLLTSAGQGSRGPQALEFGFYALLQVLSSAALLLTVHHVISHDLQAPDTPALGAAHGDWESYGVMIGFGLSIPLFFAISYAWVLWIVVPLALGQLRRFRGRARRARDPEAT